MPQPYVIRWLALTVIAVGIVVTIGHLRLAGCVNGANIYIVRWAADNAPDGIHRLERQAPAGATNHTQNPRNADLWAARSLLSGCTIGDFSRADVLTILGVVDRLMGRLGPAEQSLETASAVIAPSPRAFFELGMTYWQGGKILGAVDAWKRGGFDQWLQTVGDHLSNLGDRQMAFIAYSAASDVRPASVVPRLRKASILWFEGDVEAAMVEYRQILAADISQSLACKYLVHLLLETGSGQEAKTRLEGCLQARPREPSLRVLNARFQLEESRTHDAIRSLQALLLDDPTHAEAHFWLGHSLWISGATQDAIDHLKEAVRLGPTSIGWNLRLGEYYQALGLEEAAEVQYRTVLRLDPNNRWAIDFLEKLRTDQ